MNIKCPKCDARYEVSDEGGGSLGYCSKCSNEFVLPIPDPARLLVWAKQAPWHRVQRFMRNSAARGHNQTIIDQLIRIVEERRWIEEAKTHYELAREKGCQALSHREKAWARADKILNHRMTLDQLRHYTPEEFEKFIANLFRYQGYDAKAVGQTGDKGIDVEIRDSRGILWAIAQCKRYASDGAIGTVDVREFAGAYLISGAQKGFIFTTGSLTSQASKIAASLKWLTVCSGMALVRYIEEVTPKQDVAENENGSQQGHGA